MKINQRWPASQDTKLVYYSVSERKPRIPAVKIFAFSLRACLKTREGNWNEKVWEWGQIFSNLSLIAGLLAENLGRCNHFHAVAANSSVFKQALRTFGSWGEICESANQACLEPCSRQAIGVVKIHGPHDLPHEPCFYALHYLHLITKENIFLTMPFQPNDLTPYPFPVSGLKYSEEPPRYKVI